MYAVWMPLFAFVPMHLSLSLAKGWLDTIRRQTGRFLVLVFRLGQGRAMASPQDTSDNSKTSSMALLASDCSTCCLRPGRMRLRRTMAVAFVNIKNVYYPACHELRKDKSFIA